MAHPYLHNGDAKMRLDNTICMYNKKPVHVYVTDECEENHVKLRYVGGNNKWQFVDYTKPEFCYKSIPLGYCLYGRRSIYLSRCPLRRQKQGLHQRALRVDGRKVGDYEAEEIMAMKTFRDSILGKFPTLEEAVKMILDQDYEAVPIHRHVCIDVGDGIVMPIRYRMRLVGMYDTRSNQMTMIPGPEASVMERVFASLGLEI